LAAGPTDHLLTGGVQTGMVSVVITTFNSAKYLQACLESVSQQNYPAFEVVIVDNASTDATREILAACGRTFQIIYNQENTGFAAAQNQAMRAAKGEWLLSLNPDVLLSPDFLSQLVKAGQGDPGVGMLCGKLLRLKVEENPERSSIIDSTGIYFSRNLRHFDRGSEELDRGQYDQTEYVFGATAAAALYRRKMVEDVSVEGEFFDEDFFAYREDADVAWRAQLMGWRCLYEPTAVAWHVRRVTPQRRRRLPRVINWHSVKNRFLMRIKNISLPLYARLFFPVTFRDALILTDAVLIDRYLLSGLWWIWEQRKYQFRKRKWIQSRRRVSDKQLARWFSDKPASFPISAKTPTNGPTSS